MKLSLFHHPVGDRPLMAIGLLMIGVFALAFTGLAGQTNVIGHFLLAIPAP